MTTKPDLAPTRVNLGFAPFAAHESFLRRITRGLRNRRVPQERVVSNQVEQALADSRAIFNHLQRQAQSKGERMRDRRAA